MRKIESFTLLELIVSMLIGMILLAFLWSGYLFVTKNYLRWIGKNQTVLNVAIFEQLFRADFENSYAIVTDQEDCFQLMQKEGDIEYRFLTGVVLRESKKQTDTINCEVLGYEVEYLNGEKDRGSFVNRVDLSVRFNEESLELTFIKDYDVKFMYNDEL